MVKLLVHQYSATQMVVAQKNDDGSWLISKYWRKGTSEPWKQGKGIELPVAGNVPKRLGELLLSDGEIDGFEDVTELNYAGSEKGEPNESANYSESCSNNGPAVAVG